MLRYCDFYDLIETITEGVNHGNLKIQKALAFLKDRMDYKLVNCFELFDHPLAIWRELWLAFGYRNKVGYCPFKSTTCDHQSSQQIKTKGMQKDKQSIKWD